MDNLNLTLTLGLLTDSKALASYLQDLKAEGIPDVRERRALFHLQHTHGMEYNTLIENQLNS